MGLYLQVGLYSSPVCTVRCTGRSIRAIEVNTFIVAHEHEISFEGYLYGNGPGVLSGLMANLDLAVAVPNPVVALFSTDSGLTAHSLFPAGAIGPVILKEFRYLDTPMHMATQVKFALTATAIYNNGQELRNVVSLAEQIRIQGDGEAEVGLAPQAGAKAIFQRTADFTEVFVTQSGKLISRGSFALLPGPVITTPGAKISRQTSLTRTYKQRGTSIWLYEQDYSYSFQLPELPGILVPSYLA